MFFTTKRTFMRGIAAQLISGTIGKDGGKNIMAHDILPLRNGVLPRTAISLGWLTREDA